MRSGKGKRKLAESSPTSSPNHADSNINFRESVVWISKDNGDPCSPLSVERIPQSARRKLSKVARVKTKRNVISKGEKKKEQDSESVFPFFIDKTPTILRDALSSKRRRKDFNDSVIILNSPCSTARVNETVEPDRRESVDTVDLCSDSEEEEVVVKKKSKPKKKATGQTKKKLNEKVSKINSPDIIVLDDEEESTNSLCESNTSVIVEKTGTTSCVHPPSSTETSKTSSARTGSRWDSAQALPHNNLSLPGPSNYIPLAPPLKVTPIPPNPGCILIPLNVPSQPNLVTNDGPSTSLGPTSTAMTCGSNLLNRNPTFIRKLPNVHDPGLSEKSFGSSRNVFTEKNSENSFIPSTVGSNVFNPNGNMEQTGLRPIIIDGCNVAIAHGGDRMFSVRGLCICVEYFLRRGHTQVLALVPLHHRCKFSPRDRDIMESLRNDQHLVYTPSRFIDNRLISSYDDRYIVQYAAAVGGVIVSRDNYRDLLSENPAWKDTILNRLLMPTWVGDMLMFPVDPLGKKGPTLDEFLSFPKK